MKKSIFTVLLGASLLALIIGCERKEEVAESKPGPGSVFLWGGYDDDGLFGPYVEALLNIPYLAMPKKGYKNLKLVLKLT